MGHIRTGRGECNINANIRIEMFLIRYVVHKLLSRVTGFFVGLIKIPVLLKTSVVKKLYLVCA